MSPDPTPCLMLMHLTASPPNKNPKIEHCTMTTRVLETLNLSMFCAQEDMKTATKIALVCFNVHEQLDQQYTDSIALGIIATSGELDV